MLKEQIVARIKENIAQATDMFDYETVEDIVTLENNTATFSEITGEWVITNADIDASDRGINRLMQIEEDGIYTSSDTYYGAEAQEIQIKAHKLNIGTAIKKQFALETLAGGEPNEVKSLIIVYWKSTTNAEKSYKFSTSRDNRQQLKVSFGVMFRVPVAELEELGGCDVLDKIVMNSVIKLDDVGDVSLMHFDSVEDRFFIGGYYCVDFSFSYIENINLNDIITDRVKHFTAGIECITSKTN